MGIILAIILFSFIVFFHELGHFSLAKLNGIDVEEFAIGMGPNLISKEYKGTRYCIKLLPIGGLCMMGEDEAATDSPHNFNNKSVWARMSVIAAGPVFNFIIAAVFAIILTFMVGYDKPVVSEVEKDYPAYEAGMEAGDTILKMGDKKVHIFREVSFYNQFHQGETFEITFRSHKDGRVHTAMITPKLDETTKTTRIGIRGSGNTKANLITGIGYGVYEVKFWIDTTLQSLKMLVSQKLGLKDLSGPIGIVSTVSTTYEQSVSYGVTVVLAEMLNLAILLSANLGVMNLLPLPALDGGRLVFLIVEAVTRKRVPPEKEGYVHFAGIVLLMLLMVFVMFNDISRLLG